MFNSLKSAESCLRQPLCGKEKPPQYSAIKEDAVVDEPLKNESCLQRLILCFKCFEDIPDVNILMGSMLCPLAFILLFAAVDAACPDCLCNGHNSTKHQDDAEGHASQERISGLDVGFTVFLVLYAAVPCAYFIVKALEKCLPIRQMSVEGVERAALSGENDVAFNV